MGLHCRRDELDQPHGDADEREDAARHDDHVVAPRLVSDNADQRPADEHDDAAEDGLEADGGGEVFGWHAVREDLDVVHDVEAVDAAQGDGNRKDRGVVSHQGEGYLPRDEHHQGGCAHDPGRLAQQPLQQRRQELGDGGGHGHEGHDVDDARRAQPALGKDEGQELVEVALAEEAEC